MRGEAVAQLTNGDFCYTFVQYQLPCDVENIASDLLSLTTRIVQIHQSLGFLSQGLRNAVGDISFYVIQIIQRYLLPVLQIHSSDARFYFVVETSNDVFDRVCTRLRSEGLQQSRVHQGHFHGVLHLM